jgi:hypothetical protein
MRILYGDETHASIMKMLQTGAGPAKALAEVVSMILIQIDKKSGGKMPKQVVLPAAKEILSEAAQLMTRAGIAQVDEAVASQAAQIIVAKIVKHYGGKPKNIQKFMSRIPKDKATALAKQQQAYAMQANQPGAIQ